MTSELVARLRRPRSARLLSFAPGSVSWATLVLGLIVVQWAQWGPDWPAQEFRAGIAIHSGIVAWTAQWYAGQPLPGYSVLYPVFARGLGAAGTGVLAATVAAWTAGRLLPRTDVAAHRRYSVAVVAVLVGNLVIGQIPFLLATAFGLLALLHLAGGRLWWAGGLAAACSLSSPLAGAFLLLAVPALALHFGWRRSSVLGTALAGPAVAQVVGGAGGPFPCPWISVVSVLAFTAVTYLLTTPSDRILRRFASLYALAGVLAFVVPNPVGGNITRLGKLIALPLACYLLSPVVSRRLVEVTISLIPALVWQLVPAGTAVAQGAGDPSQHPAYYQGLLTYLKTQRPGAGRLEIPFTREHWESAFVAPRFPLARGWERQTDLQYNAILYRPITATAYEQWLRDNAVGLVALPGVPLDDGGKAEAALLARPLPFLTLVWTDGYWKVWKVRGTHPLTSGAAFITDVGATSFRAVFTEPGTAVVRIRASRLWQVTDGPACVASTPDGWLELQATRAGPVTVQARVSLQLLTGPPDCDLP